MRLTRAMIEGLRPVAANLQFMDVGYVSSFAFEVDRNGQVWLSNDAILYDSSTEGVIQISRTQDGIEVLSDVKLITLGAEKTIDPGLYIPIYVTTRERSRADISR